MQIKTNEMILEIGAKYNIKEVVAPEGYYRIVEDLEITSVALIKVLHNPYDLNIPFSLDYAKANKEWLEEAVKEKILEEAK